jgi:hypothetical protein
VNGEQIMRILLKPFFTWMLLVVLVFSAGYAIRLSYRAMLAYVQQELRRQFTQAAAMSVDRR